MPFDYNQADELEESLLLRFPEECPEWFMWTPKRGGTWGIDTDRDDVVAIRVADDDWPDMEHDVLLIVYAPSILSFCQMYLNEELGRVEALRILNEELDGGGTTPGPWVLHRAEGDKSAWEIWATEVADPKAPPGRGHLIASRSLEAGEENDSRKIAWIDAYSVSEDAGPFMQSGGTDPLCSITLNWSPG